MGLGQYLKDTQGELRHVAWPTRTQTIVFTILVVLVSVFVSLYLGLFDYIFTTMVERAAGITGDSGIEITQAPATSTSATSTPSTGSGQVN